MSEKVLGEELEDFFVLKFWEKFWEKEEVSCRKTCCLRLVVFDELLSRWWLFQSLKDHSMLSCWLQMLVKQQLMSWDDDEQMKRRYLCLSCERETEWMKQLSSLNFMLKTGLCITQPFCRMLSGMESAESVSSSQSLCNSFVRSLLLSPQDWPWNHCCV